MSERGEREKERPDRFWEAKFVSRVLSEVLSPKKSTDFPRIERAKNQIDGQK